MSRHAFKNQLAFTLLELMIVVAIIGMLIIQSLPELNVALARARSAACATNLQQIGTAVNLYLIDNDNTYPIIESGAGMNIYPPGSNAQPISTVLAPYGVTNGTGLSVLRCPQDVLVNNRYQQLGSSYMWLPILDGETNSNPIIFTRRGAMQVRLSRLRLCTDYDSIHNNHMNALYADGHVVVK